MPVQKDTMRLDLIVQINLSVMNDLTSQVSLENSSMSKMFLIFLQIIPIMLPDISLIMQQHLIVYLHFPYLSIKSM